MPPPTEHRVSVVLARTKMVRDASIAPSLMRAMSTT